MSEAIVDKKPSAKSSPSLDRPARAASPIINEKIVQSSKDSPNHSKSEEVEEPITKEKNDQPSAGLPPPTPPTTAPTTTTDKAEAGDQLKNQPENNENNVVPHDEGEESGPLVDMETFGQLLEMDDDEEHSFSKSLTWDYFDQAVTTFKEMDAAVLGGDLLTLSRKGHFLKGSSAALGLNKVKASCEKMQHYGNRKKANGEGALSESEAMEKCKSLLAQLKEQQKLSKAWLERFYAERNV